jgi:hypothetical protein
MFGRRSTPAAEPAPADAQAGTAELTQQRIIPAELWDGELGDALRSIGKHPDDEANLVPTGASIDARVARDRSIHEARLAEINREVARQTGGRVAPFFLFGESVWNSEIGSFLMARLKFFPFDHWNVLFLPADERTAAMLNLPVCPRDEIPGTLDVIGQWHAEAKAKLDTAIAEARRTQQFGAIVDVENDVKADVWGLASYLANHIGAAEAWKPRG